MVDRRIVIPAPYMGMVDAELTLDSPDGERGNMELAAGGTIIARGEGFGAPQIGPSLLEMTDAQLAEMFGGFLSHALESSEPDARDGWPILFDDIAADYATSCALIGEWS